MVEINFTRTLTARVVDVSDYGLRFYSNEKLDVGDNIALAINSTNVLGQIRWRGEVDDENKCYRIRRFKGESKDKEEIENRGSSLEALRDLICGHYEGSFMRYVFGVKLNEELPLELKDMRSLD